MDLLELPKLLPKLLLPKGSFVDVWLLLLQDLTFENLNRLRHVDGIERDLGPGIQVPCLRKKMKLRTTSFLPANSRP